jgi:hypothetical protein
MQEASKGVAWICIVSTLLLGCYSAALIDPRGDEKENIRSGEIEFVIMTDSTKYVFDEPPSVVNDTIINDFRRIPLSEVAYAAVVYDPRSSEKTWSDRISYIVTRDGTRYDFESPPRLVKDTVVGELEHAPGDTTRNWSVAVALSDVAYASDSTDTINWITWGVVGFVLCAAMVAALVYLQNTNPMW